MKRLLFSMSVIIVIFMISCDSKISRNISENKIETENNIEVKSDTLTTHLKPFNKSLPTIGLLMYNGILTTEITATADVFAKTENGKQLFNVITIAETKKPIVTEEGITIVPDYTFINCPRLTALFVPSAYDMYAQVYNKKIIDFIQLKDKETQYTISNCAGAQLIGASGIAKGRKIVTWIGGGEQLQKEYPELKVQNDSIVHYVEDGKYLSSNGNLISYISALNLVEKISSPEHRKFVEGYIYINELKNYTENDL